MIPYTPEEITSEWLTEALYRNGVLSRGKVISQKRRRDQSTPFSNRIVFLDLTFSEEVSTNVPRSVVYKSQESEKEYYFYTDLLDASPNVPVLDCYFSHYNTRSKYSVLLFSDISESYSQTQWPVPPTDSECEKAIAALAQLHAAWWERSQLSDAKKKLKGENNWKKRYQDAIYALPNFLDYLGERISRQRRATFERIIPVVEQSLNHREKITLIHGDAHYWNFMFSREGIKNAVKILDWNLWDVGAASDDLAYMMGLHWYPERRHRLEIKLLQKHHSKMIEKGVRDYRFDDLWEDYRLSCIRNMFIPVWQWTQGIHPSVWWFHYERSFLTYDDLGCEELL